MRCAACGLRTDVRAEYQNISCNLSGSCYFAVYTNKSSSLFHDSSFTPDTTSDLWLCAPLWLCRAFTARPRAASRTEDKTRTAGHAAPNTALPMQREYRYKHNSPHHTVRRTCRAGGHATMWSFYARGSRQAGFNSRSATKRKFDPTPVPVSILLSFPWLLGADMDGGEWHTSPQGHRQSPCTPMIGRIHTSLN